MDQITDDILVEILSRVPYRSLPRCSCVSRRWRALIAHPDHRRKLPQTLAGFFYHDDPTICFADASGNGPPLVDTSLAFLLDRELRNLNLLDSYHGLLLCSCFRLPDYLVINPATEKWVTVPVPRRESGQAGTAAHLGFDPAFSSHFYVFEFQLDSDGDCDDDQDADGLVLGVKIYSSETGLWSYKQSGWSDEVYLASDCKSVFVDGMLYVANIAFIIGAVDVEGKTWRIIDFPYSEKPFLDAATAYIDLSQGQLHLVIGICDASADKLGIWVLEDRNSEEWTIKHTVSFEHLVGWQYVLSGYGDFQYIVVAVHPDRNIVFFVIGDKRTLMSYDMDSGEVCTIRELGRDCCEYYCIPYVPLFSDSMANGKQ